ncbi:MAG: hypothetical protein ABFS37_06245 [Acidobacteriota bacterium]
MRGEIGELDPMLPVADVRTLTQHLSRSVAPQRFNTLLLALFAAAGAQDTGGVVDAAGVEETG